MVANVCAKIVRCLPWCRFPGTIGVQVSKCTPRSLGCLVSKQDYPCIAKLSCCRKSQNTAVKYCPCQALLNFLELAKENEKGRDFPLQQQASQPTPTVSAIQSCLIQGTHAMNQISLFQSHILPLPLTRRPSPPSLPSFPLSALLLSCLFPFPCSPASLGHENHKRALAG